MPFIRLGNKRDLLARTNTPGFGNARDVGNLLEVAIRAQAGRLLREREAGGEPDPMLIDRSDLLGPKDRDISTNKAWQELQSMVGLRAVKDAVQQLLALTKTNAELEELEKPTRDIFLNRVFLGNPGTGEQHLSLCWNKVWQFTCMQLLPARQQGKPNNFMQKHEL